MECQHCGKPLPESATRFCPWCGHPVSASPSSQPTPPSPPPPPVQAQVPPPPPVQAQMPPPPPFQPAPGPAPAQSDTRQQVAAAANEARKVAGQVATEVSRALEDPRLREAIPGRSLSIAGLGLMALAILLAATPWFSGIGLIWSLIMLAGGALTAVMELRRGNVRVQGLDSLPPSLLHPLIPPVFALLTAVHAYLLLSLGVISILWTGAAGLLLYDQYKKAMADPEGPGRRFDPRLAMHGYRAYIVIGAAICLLSLFLTWESASSRFSGGYDMRYSSYTGGYVYDYNFTKYYFPGYAFSGRNLTFASLAVIAFVGLMGWSAYRGHGTVPAWFNHIAGALGGVALLFVMVNWGNDGGVLVYLIGLLPIAFALTMIYRGQHTGPYDLQHLFKRGR